MLNAEYCPARMNFVYARGVSPMKRIQSKVLKKKQVAGTSPTSWSVKSVRSPLLNKRVKSLVGVHMSINRREVWPCHRAMSVGLIYILALIRA